MRPLILTFLIVSSLVAQARPFTNTAGKTINAEIARATETDVWLRTSNGRTSKVPLSALSTDDQAFIKKWLMDALPNVKIEPKLARGLKEAKDHPKWESKQNFTLTVSFRNDSGDKDLEETEATLFLVGKASVDDKVFKILSRITKTISLPGNKSDTIEFPKIENYFSKNKGFHALSYVLEVKRVRDNKQLHLSSPNAYLKKRMSDIITRNQDDITDSTFLKVVPAEGSKFESEVKVSGE